MVLTAKTIEMELERETKGAVLYKASPTGQPPACDSIYIRKWSFPNGKYPPRIKVIIEAENIATLARTA